MGSWLTAPGPRPQSSANTPHKYALENTSDTGIQQRATCRNRPGWFHFHCSGNLLEEGLVQLKPGIPLGHAQHHTDTDTYLSRELSLCQACLTQWKGPPLVGVLWMAEAQKSPIPMKIPQGGGAKHHNAI